MSFVLVIAPILLVCVVNTAPLPTPALTVVPADTFVILGAILYIAPPLLISNSTILPSAVLELVT